jgi:transcriptional regulator with XRE-family HTH domain
VPRQRIGARVKRWREARGLSQLALAKRAKVTQSYISELEAGIKGRRPGVAVLQRLARALDLPVTELLPWNGRRIPAGGE